jgi:membrane-bound metal-dependent hydrolase YbcI (DUF457 family)
MPTPVGHALGGLAAAFLTSSASRRAQMSPQVLTAAAAAAVTPDLDILVGAHRSYTHSIGATALVAAVSWLILRRRSTFRAKAVSESKSRRDPPAVVATMALASAFASHLVLDWLGKDTSAPPGLTLLWPFSSAYYLSGCDLFGEVSRRYWLPEEFIFGNLLAMGWELAVLTPLAFLAWVVWSGRTLKRG